ncbi:DIS3-like exonuclease 1 [Halichondria panicea]|uniref:DIS3-like exonuclease 1 n=1 Tax=Halichondria panicea TaxID=6063 RepID=UPI00312BA701
MIRCEKQVRIGYGKGRRGYVSVTREHYLRDDISCKVEKCILCDEEDSGLRKQAARLIPNSSHYIIPDTPVLSDFMEVVEHPSVVGVVLLQTPLSHIRNKKGRRSHSKLVSLLSRPEKQCVLFSNEHHVETFLPRLSEETTRQWHTRLILRAGVWYSNHIQAAGRFTPIVIVTSETEYEMFPKPDPSENVRVVAVGDYLRAHLPAQAELHLLCESLLKSAELSTNSRVKTEFSNYLSDEIIKEGLSKGHIMRGSLHVSRHHSRDEAYVRLKSESKDQSSDTVKGEVLIYGNISRNRGLHGDVVAVQLLPRAQWRSRSGKLADSTGSSSDVMATGVVVGVILRKEKEYVASFEETSEPSVGSSKSTKVLVYPYDMRVPKIRIGTRQAADLRGHRIVVRIDSWEVDSQYPNGHFVRSIGPIGSLETETAVILIEHDLSNNSFSKALLNELPSNSAESRWCVEEGSSRRDLRASHLVFSIDPQGCEDVDDTLSVRRLENGCTELGVHIADVSHFVRPGSLTDEEAASRSTTIYLADRRYDMLPGILSADLCSLLSNVDRYAVSVVWVLDSRYRVQKVWYGRTIIRSKYKLAYETAQALYDGVSAQCVLKDISELHDPPLLASELEKRVEELRSAIGSLVTISRVLRHRRAMEGALELESVEVKVQISESDSTNIEDLIPKQPLEMHEVIAECMIFANHWVAKKIHGAYPTQALLRHHPPPSLDRLASLTEIARVKGFTISADSNKALAESLNNCVDPQDPSVNTIIRNLATQAMNQAAYFSTGSLPNKDYIHYGLALDLYTHFTSPIRRYADLIVHRQLLSALENPSEDTALLPGNNRLTEMAQHMNDRHRSAQLAQLSSTELFQCLYFSSLKPGEARDRVEGVIVGLRPNGITVMVPRYGIRSMVYLKDKNGLILQPTRSPSEEGVTFNTGSIEVTSHSVIVTHSGRAYTLRLFDRLLLRVCVETSHAHGHSLGLKLLQCQPLEPESGFSGGGKDATTKALVKAVQIETESEDEIRYSQDLEKITEYRQSSSTSSLYCLIHNLQRLSLTEITDSV